MGTHEPRMVNMLQRCSGLWQWQQSIKERTGLGDFGVGGGMMVIRREIKSADKILSIYFTTTAQSPLNISSEDVYKAIYLLKDI